MRLVYITLGWVAGILLAEQGILTLSFAVWVVLAAALLLLVTVSWPVPRYRWINIALLMLALGGLRYSFVPQTSSISQLNDTGGLTIEGVVAAEPDIRDDRVLLRVETERARRGGVVYNVNGAVLVRLPRSIEVAEGDHVTVTGRLATPATYDTFSYEEFLARQGVYSIMDHASLREIRPPDGPSLWRDFQRALADARRDLMAQMGRMLPEPQAGLLAGIVLGNERGISPELADDFSKTGASHVIAISGFNMALIAGLVTALLKKTRLPVWSQSIAGVTIIAVYTLFTGANAAVVRAAIMSSLVVLGQTRNRRAYAPASLAAAALAMSALSPNILWNLSFQLSFFAVLGMMVFVDPLTEIFERLLYTALPLRVARLSHGLLFEPIVVTLAASLTTLPIILLYFGRLSVVFLPVNLLILPAQTVLLLLGGLATLVLIVAPPLAQALYWLDYALLSWTIGVVRIFAGLPFADVPVSAGAVGVYVYLAGLIGWVMMDGTQPDWWLSLTGFLRRRAVASTAMFSGVALLVVLGLVAWDRPDGDLHVWFLDVGHSNAVLVQTPGGAQILVDGGRYPSRLLTAIGDRIPFTDRQLELVVISHPDPFDYGALPAVLRRYDAGAVLTNGQPNESAEFAELMELAAQFPVVEAEAGYSVTFDDGVTLEVLHPSRKPTLNTGIDSAPLVLRLTYGEVSFLLPSNLDPPGQAALMEAGYWPLATVVQLPDHGAARSLAEPFIDAAQPSLAIVQADRANRRGDPNADVLAMLPENAALLRTDDGGAIHLWTDGERLWSSQEG